MHVLFQSWVHLILIQWMHPDRAQQEMGADLPVDVAGERRTTGIWIAYRHFWLKSRRKDEPLLTFTFLHFVSVVDLESPRPEHLRQNTFILTRADAGPQQNHITSWNIKEWSGHQRPTQTFVSHYHIPRSGQQIATHVTVLPEWLIHRKDMKTHQKYLALGWNGDG